MKVVLLFSLLLMLLFVSFLFLLFLFSPLAAISDVGVVVCGCLFFQPLFLGFFVLPFKQTGHNYVFFCPTVSTDRL